MNTKNALLKIINILDANLPDGISKDNLYDAIDVIKASLVHRKKFEGMWEKFLTKYGHLKLFPQGSTLGPNTVATAMDMLFTEFFGSIPKSKDREEKFDKIIQAVYNSYIYASEKVNDERENIISKLIKLRDEEKGVCLK